MTLQELFSSAPQLTILISGQRQHTCKTQLGSGQHPDFTANLTALMYKMNWLILLCCLCTALKSRGVSEPNNSMRQPG